MSNVELLAGWSSFKLLSIETVNGFLGTLWSVLFVDSFRVIVADESDLSDLVLHQVERLDFSEGLEHVLDLVLWVVHRNVLDVDVVDQLSDVSSVLWLEFHGNSVFVLGGSLNGFGGGGLIVEADEAVASRGVVGVEGYLQGLDLTDRFKFLLKVLMLLVLWDGSDEYVGSSEFFFV